MRKSFSNYLNWFKKWKTAPVRSWIKAADAYKRKDFAKAEELYEKGLARHPNHPAVLNARLDLAFCKFKLRKPKEAEKILSSITTHKPGLAEGWIRLAKLLLWMGKPGKASRILFVAEHYLSDHEELKALRLFALTELRQEMSDEAYSLKEELCKRNSESLLTQVALSMYEARYGDPFKGREMLTKLCTHPQSPVEALHGIAELYLEERNTTMAKHFLRRTLHVTPDNPMTLSLLAEVYLISESLPEFAIQVAQQACQLSQWQSPRMMHTLVKAHLASGDKVSALLIASRAREVTDEPYPQMERLGDLVEKLSSISLA